MPVHTKQDLIKVIQKHQATLRQLGIKRLGVFGSFVRGEQHRDSDIDLLVEFEPAQKTFRNFMKAAFLLEDETGRRIEMLTPESLSPYIGPHILKEVEYVPFTDQLSPAYS